MKLRRMLAMIRSAVRMTAARAVKAVFRLADR
jgi:hypothetical protein